MTNRPVDEFEQEMYAKVKKRIEVIESPDYEFPEEFSKGDWVGVFAVLSICVIWMIIGIATI